MEYKIQPGDTITRVTRQLGTDWKTLKNANPTAVARSAKTGDWIVKAGKTVSVPSSFQEILAQQTAKQPVDSAGQTASTPTPKTDNQQQATASRGETVHVLQKGETIWGLARKKYRVDPAELVRLNKISNPNKLRIGQEIRIPTGETAPATTDSSENVVASWYGKSHHGLTMANGARFNMNGATIAHRDIPLGTAVELENPETGEKVQAVVTDRGPFIEGRDVDLSYGLAKRLSLVRQGVGNLKMRVL